MHQEKILTAAAKKIPKIPKRKKRLPSMLVIIRVFFLISYYGRINATIIEADSQGWVALPSPSLTCALPTMDPAILSLGPRTQQSRLSILRQILPDKLVNERLVVPLNTILAAARRSAKANEVKRLGALDVRLLWCFIARWLLEFTVPGVRTEKRHFELRERAFASFGKNRYPAVHERLVLGTAQFLHLVDGVRQQLAELIDFGSVVTIDDQLISYYGQDMRNESLAVQIPSKPHGYGLFSVAAAVKLPKCGLRVLVDLEVQEAGNKITPPTALTSILKRLRSRVRYQFISVFDSAFVTKQTIGIL